MMTARTKGQLMSDHELAENLAGLASRVDNLVHLTLGNDSRTLQDQEERLAKLTLVAIARDMDATNELYRDAVTSVQAATSLIGDADKRIQHIAQVIKAVADAVDAAEQVLKKVMV
jgi:hypothetical protein